MQANDFHDIAIVFSLSTAPAKLYKKQNKTKYKRDKQRKQE